MAKKIIVIGGGIVGLSTAYFLHQEGHEVVIIDKTSMTAGASYVNAGYLTPSHIVPLAAPGMITKGLKWMFDSSSPFYIKPRLDLGLMNWGLKFMRSCSKKHVQRSLKVIKDINVLSKELYHDFDALPTLDFHLENKGVLMAFQTAAAEKAEGEVMREAKKLGLDVALIDRKQVHVLQPEIDMHIAGAYHYRCDAHTTPGSFMEQMKAYLLRVGVKMHKETMVEKLLYEGRKVPIGIHLPVQAGKGYRLNEEKPTGICMPAILMERKVAVTPMQGFTRFSGTMEIAGINQNIRKNRVEAIAAAAASYYPGLSISKKTKAAVQCGLRPLSPDGLPFIGRHSAYENLTIATGHSMMGWSLGPATGKLITELISGQKTSLDLSPFAVERKYG